MLFRLELLLHIAQFDADAARLFVARLIAGRPEAQSDFLHRHHVG